VPGPTLPAPKDPSTAVAVFVVSTAGVAGVMAGLEAGADAPEDVAEELVVSADAAGAGLPPASGEAGGGAEPEPPPVSVGAAAVGAAPAEPADALVSAEEAVGSGELAGLDEMGSASPEEPGDAAVLSLPGAGGGGVADVCPPVPALGGGVAPAEVAVLAGAVARAPLGVDDAEAEVDPLEPAEVLEGASPGSPRGVAVTDGGVLAAVGWVVVGTLRAPDGVTAEASRL
jgi:hypothetical protein